MDLLCREIVNLYEPEEMVYNVHSISHMANDIVKENYNMHEYSCFDFESYLSQLVKLVRGCRHPLQQLSRRILKTTSCNSISSIKLHTPEIVRTVSVITKVTYKYLWISTQMDNNRYNLTKHLNVLKVSKIEIIDNEIFLIGNIFQNEGRSEKVWFFKTNGLTSFEFHCLITHVITKCFMIPLDHSFICIALLHGSQSVTQFFIITSSLL